MRSTSRQLPALIALALAGCLGVVDEGPARPSGSPRPERPLTPEQLAPSATTAIPRLSRRELDRTLADVLGIEGAAARYLPEDPAIVVDPTSMAELEVFDTSALTKTPSQVFVDGIESLAFEVAAEFGADTSAVDAMAGCSPAGGAWDAGCARALAQRLGERLWRRPLSPDEVEGLMTRATPFGEANGHYVAVRAIVQSLLLSPEFMYRTEIGVDQGDGLRRLEGYELVSRLSYFLWGTTPTPEMLDGAAEVSGDEALTALALSMIDDPRADAQVLTFHRLWLRYERAVVSDPTLAADMQAETDALLERVLITDRSAWTSLWSSPETFVTPALATHYGLSEVPSVASWVAYGEGERAGILSHGSVLSHGATRGVDTRPSARGAMIARRLLCLVITPPPDVNVDAGVEVPPDSCKPEAYAAHRSGTCAGCHAVIDPIGFGLERYDGVGRYRETEVVNPSCVIEGRGAVSGVEFSGPAQLGARLIESGALVDCGAQQLVRFAMRREVSRDDDALVSRLTRRVRESGDDVRALVLAVALDPTFQHRREAP